MCIEVGTFTVPEFVQNILQNKGVHVIQAIERNGKYNKRIETEIGQHHGFKNFKELN